MNPWGLLIFAGGAVLAAAAILAYVREGYRERLIRLRAKAFGRTDEWAARDYKRGTIGAFLVGCVVMVLGVVVMVH